ncbi:hypothetical protein L9F63_024231, partial [Diploptera punctata]
MDRPFLCEDCGLSFKWKKDLNRHITCKHQKEEYICDTCKKSFTRRDVLLRHINEVHGQKQIVCNTCSKVFKSNRYLQDHQICHTQNVKTVQFKNAAPMEEMDVGKAPLPRELSPIAGPSGLQTRASPIPGPSSVHIETSPNAGFSGLLPTNGLLLEAGGNKNFTLIESAFKSRLQTYAAKNLGK